MMRFLSYSMVQAGLLKSILSGKGDRNRLGLARQSLRVLKTGESKA